jgi:hypothetical protein
MLRRSISVAARIIPFVYLLDECPYGGAHQWVMVGVDPTHGTPIHECAKCGQWLK